MKIKVKYFTPIINFPDYQARIYKNDPKIKWEGKVHETITGYETIAELPTEEYLCLLHHKSISKQEQQNKLYETL